MRLFIVFLVLFMTAPLSSQYGKAELRHNTKPKVSPEHDAKLMTMISGGVDVDVLEYETPYWLIKYDTIIGWVYSKDLYKNRVMNTNIGVVRREEERAKNVDKRKRIIDLYGEQYVNRIMNHQVWIGMTKAMLIESRGYPDDRNTTQTAGGLHEQWIYGKDISHRMYVYLEDRVVTAIQK